MKIIKNPYFILLLLLAVIVFFINSIKIHHINCKSQYGPCSREAQTFLDGLEGKSLAAVRKSIKGFLKDGLVVKDYTASYKVPNKYEIRIIERKPMYALLFSQTSQIALVDDEGYALSFEENTSLPLVKTERDPQSIIETVDDETLFALKLMRDMHFFYQVNEGEMDDDSLRMKLNSGERVIFPLNGDKGILLASLGLVLSRLNSIDNDLKIETGIINTIDLRFNNPVLR